VNGFPPILVVFSDKEMAVVAVVPARPGEERADSADFLAPLSSCASSALGTAETGSGAREANPCRRFLKRNREPHTLRD